MKSLLLFSILISPAFSQTVAYEPIGMKKVGLFPSGSSGSGTVTTSGSITTNALVTAAGATSIKTICAGCTLDASGNAVFAGGVQATSFTAVSGGIAGYFQSTQGTAPTLVPNSWLWYAGTAAPAAGAAYVAPAASGTGFMLATNTAGVHAITHIASAGTGSVCLTISCPMVTPSWTGTAAGGALTLTTVLAGAYGGTGNGFFAIAGPASTLKTWTIPNSSIDWTALTGVAKLAAGVPSVVSGSASDCVKVDGSSGSCGGGGGTGSSAVNVTPVTANANSTSAQTLMEIPLTAGYLNTAAAKYKIHGSGTFKIAVAQTPTLTYTAKLCTVSGCGSGTVVTLASATTGATVMATDNGWNLNLDAATTATGASGNLIVHGNLAVDIGALPGTAATVNTDLNTGVSGNINLAAALFIDFTVTTSTGNSGNTFTQQLGSIDPQVGATVSSVNGLTGTAVITVTAGSGISVSGGAGATPTISATGGAMLYQGYSSAGAAGPGSGATLSYNIVASIASSSTESTRRTPILVSGNITRFFINFSGTQPAAGTMTCTLLVNGASSGIAVTIANSDGANAPKTATGSVAVTAVTDWISYTCVNAATSSGATMNYAGVVVQ